MYLALSLPLIVNWIHTEREYETAPTATICIWYYTSHSLWYGCILSRHRKQDQCYDMYLALSPWLWTEYILSVNTKQHQLLRYVFGIILLINCDMNAYWAWIQNRTNATICIWHYLCPWLWTEYILSVNTKQHQQLRYVFAIVLSLECELNTYWTWIRKSANSYDMYLTFSKRNALYYAGSSGSGWPRARQGQVTWQWNASTYRTGETEETCVTLTSRSPR